MYIYDTAQGGWTKLYGQNGVDKMVWTEWYTDKMLVDKMVWTKRQQFLVDFNSIEFNLYQLVTNLYL